MHYLLDKNVVRHAVTALRDARRRPLLPLELGALSFWQVARRRGVILFISRPSYNVLQRRRHYREALVFLKFSEVLSPTRYHTRWARRVRETSKLSREDAAMIALATFGSDSSGTILGVPKLITYDFPMINGYQKKCSRLERRLQAMTAQLHPPFDKAILPKLMTPDDVLTEWAS